MMNYEHALEEYTRVRDVRIDLNNKLVKQLSRKTLLKGGRALGLLVDNVLCFETEDESCVLMDYCIHDCRDLGRNAIDRYLARPRLDANERQLLEAMQRAWFSLFRVESTVRGVGVEATDMLRASRVFLIDVNLSQCRPDGLMLATRVVHIHQWLMTTGAPLPVDPDDLADIRAALAAWRGVTRLGQGEGLSRQEQAELAATILRVCLRRGASNRVRYAS